MKRMLVGLVVAIAIGGTGVVVSADRDHGNRFEATLRGFSEVPSVSTTGRGFFNARVNKTLQQITWTLSYRNIVNTVTQAHLHFAQPGVNGGIMVFLCTNLGNGPAGTQACPPAPATISGTITPADITSGANAQGIAPGDFAELLKALKAGVVYANVHSDVFPGGEVRGQVGDDDHDDDD
jgi:hypothetical protein